MRTDTVTQRPDASTDTAHHYVACHDNDVAKCGANVSSVPWVDDPIDCVVCVYMDADEPEYEDEPCTCPCCGEPA